MDQKIKALIEKVQARVRKLPTQTPEQMREKELIESELFQLADLSDRQQRMYEWKLLGARPQPMHLRDAFCETKAGMAILERAMRADPLRTEMDLADLGEHRALSLVGATSLAEEHRARRLESSPESIGLETARI